MAAKPMSKVCRMHATDEIVKPILHAMIDRGMDKTRVAEKTKIPRSTLYGALSDPCGCRLETILRIAAAVGLSEVTISTENFKVR